jgi:hypothetical protein
MKRETGRRQDLIDIEELQSPVKTVEPISPDWKWGKSDGSRRLDRLLDQQLTFREILEWLEGAETLSHVFRPVASGTRGPKKSRSPGKFRN